MKIELLDTRTLTLKNIELIDYKVHSKSQRGGGGTIEYQWNAIRVSAFNQKNGSMRALVSRPTGTILYLQKSERIRTVVMNLFYSVASELKVLRTEDYRFDMIPNIINFDYLKEWVEKRFKKGATIGSDYIFVSKFNIAVEFRIANGILEFRTYEDDLTEDYVIVDLFKTTSVNRYVKALALLQRIYYALIFDGECTVYGFKDKVNNTPTNVEFIGLRYNNKKFKRQSLLKGRRSKLGQYRDMKILGTEEIPPY